MVKGRFGSLYDRISGSEGTGLAALLRRLSVVVFRRAADATLRFEQADGRCAELLGISTATLIGDAYSFWSHVLPEDRARTLGVLAEALRKGSVYRVEYRLCAANGRVHRVVEEGAAIRDESDGEVIGLEGVITEASSLPEQVATLASESQRRYDALVSQSDEMIAEISGDAKIAFASERFCKELGHELKDLVGRDPLSLVHAHDRPHVLAAGRRALDDGRTGKVLCRIERGDGAFIWGEVAGRTFETGTGEVRAILTGHDVSHRVRIEEAFLAQRTAEARIGELSRRFLELGSEGLDRAIGEGLESAAAIASADRCYLLDFAGAGKSANSLDGMKIYLSGEDASGIDAWAQGQGPKHTWMREILKRGDVVRINRLSDLSAEFAETRATFEQRGIRSFCAIPVRTDGRMTALLGVQNSHCEHEWTEQEIALLRLVAELFASALKRRAVEGALRDGENRLRALTDGAQDALCETEIQSGRILYANPRFFEMLGHDPKDSAGMSCYSLMHPDDLDKTQAMEAAFARGGLGTVAAGFLLYRARHRQGQWLWLEANGRMFKTAAGELRSSSVIRDVTEREVAKRAIALRLEQESLIAKVARRLLAVGVDGIDEGFRAGLGSLAEISLADRSWLVNTLPEDLGAVRAWQWSRVGFERPRTDLDLLQDGFSTARVLLAEGLDVRIPADPRFVADSPERRWLALRGARALLVVPLLSGAGLVGLLGFERVESGEDWSDDSIALLRLAGGTFASALSRKRAEEALRDSRNQLLQAQKMEAVGTLAGGVAHDFNNQLSVILGNSRYVRREIPAGSDLAEALVDLERAGEHCAQLTRSLLSFSRRSPAVRQRVPVSRVIADAKGLIRPLLPPSIGLSTRVHDDSDCVLVDPTQLQQVLVNLMVNARDAMPAGGDLSLETAHRTFDEADARRCELDLPGEYIEFSLADTGVGMEPATMARIFEPFFTTKVQGKGTGLGLATVYGLARDSGGSVTVESEVARGSTFRLFLPRYSGEGVGHPSAVSAAVEARRPARVLVVDDEAAARRLIRRMLEGGGFEVVEAGDGDEALEVALAPGAGIDVLLSDLFMPKLGGIEVARRLRASQPELRVLLVTGSNDDGTAIPGARVLAKPFTRAELLEALHALLGEGDGRTFTLEVPAADLR